MVRRLFVVALGLVAVISGAVWGQYRARQGFLLACEEKTAPLPTGCGCNAK